MNNCKLYIIFSYLSIGDDSAAPAGCDELTSSRLVNGYGRILCILYVIRYQESRIIRLSFTTAVNGWALT